MSNPSPSTVFTASTPVRANRNGRGGQYFPVFNIMRSTIENLVGKRLELGGFYHIVGTIEDAFDFDIHRVIKTHLRIMTRLEYRDNVEFGKVYNFKLRSIEEVRLNEKQREIVANSVGVQYRPLMYRLGHAKDGLAGTEEIPRQEPVPSLTQPSRFPAALHIENIDASFVLRAFLHEHRGERKYVRLPNQVFEQKTGLKLEEMRDYVIRGEIEGVGPFKKILERCAARQDIPIYLSSYLSKEMVVGTEYILRVNSIDKMAPRALPWEGVPLDGSRPWSWKEVGSWVDTEGAVCSRSEKGTGNYLILISQKEKRVLAEIAYFLHQQGLKSYIRLHKDTGVYNLQVVQADGVARVIKEIEPYIRTENKITQILEFKKSICRPRRHLWPSIKNAREILGLANKIP